MRFSSIILASVLAVVTGAVAVVDPDSQPNTCTSDADCNDGKLRGGQGKCITQAAGSSGLTKFCAYTTCNFGYGIRPVPASGRPGVTYNACVKCGEDRAFDDTSQCGAAVSTFECTSTREGLQLNTACSNGDSFAGTSGVCVVPARVSSGFQSGRSFVNSADNIGPGYCAYRSCYEGATAVPNAFFRGNNGYRVCIPTNNNDA